MAPARTPVVLDDLARKLWRAHAERQIEGADAEVISGAIEARRAALAGKAVSVTQIGPKAALGPPRTSRPSCRDVDAIAHEIAVGFLDHVEVDAELDAAMLTPSPMRSPSASSHSRRSERMPKQNLMSSGMRAARSREKMFGVGRPHALDRNAKVRIMHWARCLSRRIEKGRAYGVVTAKVLAVLEALLWGFHNAKNGLCFPSYERIAEAAHCARSTVAEKGRHWASMGLAGGWPLNRPADAAWRCRSLRRRSTDVPES
jgi:hypothetical protein